MPVHRTVEGDEQAPRITKEPDGKEHGDGQARGECHPLRSAEPEHEPCVEKARDDDGDAIVDVDRPEVEARFRREDAAAVRAGVVHAEAAAKQTADAALGAPEPHRPPEGLAAGGRQIHRVCVVLQGGVASRGRGLSRLILPGMSAATQPARGVGRHPVPAAGSADLQIVTTEA